MDRHTFNEMIYTTWATYFEGKVEDFSQPGVGFYPRERYADLPGVFIWYIGQQVLIEVNPAYQAEVEAVLGGFAGDEPLSSQTFAKAWGEERIKEVDTGRLYYLYPPDLVRLKPPPSFTSRQLTLADESLLANLLATSTPEEIDEADVAVDQDMAFGCFKDGELVAAASIYPWRGFVDIGVLTHPAYRGKGLGKTVVSLLCQHVNLEDEIYQYRYNINNTGSKGIAKGVGFTPYFTQVSVWLNF
jgi:RimJ/RimL family protein N-acetyltransferase